MKLNWVTIHCSDRLISVGEDHIMYLESVKLDGCYVLKTDLTEKHAAKETIHNRYKDLALVETAFRTSKTFHLELRPIYVRLASRTRGHVFVGVKNFAQSLTSAGSI